MALLQRLIPGKLQLHPKFQRTGFLNVTTEFVYVARFVCVIAEMHTQSVVESTGLLQCGIHFQVQPS